MLDRAMPVEAPPGLGERVYRATADSFITAGVRSEASGNGNGASQDGFRVPADGLADDLERALAADPPADLADRVSQATAERFEAQTSAGHARDAGAERPAVLGRIGPGLHHLGRAGLAAAALVLVAVGVWQTGPGTEPEGPRGAVEDSAGAPAIVAELEGEGAAGGEVDEQAGRIVQQIERSLRPPAEPIDARIMALSAELDQFAQAMEFDRAGNELLEATGRELDRSYMLEGRMNAF